MKIVFLTNSYPSEKLPMGGYLEDIAVELVHRKHQVQVLVHSNQAESKKYQLKGVEIIEYPISLFWNPRLYQHTEIIASLKKSILAWVELFISVFSSYFYLKRYARDADVIHAAWFIPSGCVACWVGRTIKKPAIATALGAEFHLPKVFLIRYLLKWVYRSSREVTANSQYLAKKSEEYGLNPEKFAVIPTAINLSNYSYKIERTGEKIVLACVSRLIPAKRVNDFIGAIALLPDKILSQIDAIIIGDGPERIRLQKMVAGKGLDGKIRFLGMIPHPELVSALKDVDILINPTTSDEGMATINLEVMAMGICPIATDGYGNNEVIQHGATGYLYAPQDIQTLARILEDLVQDKNRIKVIGQSASEYVRREHDIKKITSKYIELYENVLLSKTAWKKVGS